jgi:ATP-binding cassette subfamily C protein CydCD
VALGVTCVTVTLTVPAAGVPLAAGLVIAAVLAPALAARDATRRAAATARARAELRDAIVESIDGIEESRSLAVPNRRSLVLAALEARAAQAAGRAAGLAHLGWGVAVVGAAVLLGHSETAAVLLLAVVTLAEPIAALPDAAVARRRAQAADDRLAASAPPRGTEPPTISPWADEGPAGGGLVVRDLVAGWNPTGRPALNHLDLTVPRGRSLAVLGRSGSGKSTLAAVLTGFLTPRAGRITTPGTVGLVSDDADHIFATTLRENLRLARPGVADGELAEVLDRVGLPGWGDRLDQWLGAGGSTVSGGQRRRLATARALLADPALLILDEPTEGLDEPSAEALMADLLAATHGRTVLLLTHRTEGLDRVDECLTLTSFRIDRRPASQMLQNRSLPTISSSISARGPESCG